jgi:hypothetical protein
MNNFKLYRRASPITLRARPLEIGDVVYDARGLVLAYQPGDMLVELETDRFVLDRTLFDDLYIEVTTHGTDTTKSDISQADAANLGGC